jgi:hypothetical protein
MQLRTVAIVMWVVAGLAVVVMAYKLLFARPDRGGEAFPPLPSTGIIERGDGHAYRYVAAANITWARARDAAAAMRSHGRRGYLATIEDKAEFDFILHKVFPKDDTDVTYLGGRQTAPGEWRWVTGPDAAADGGKGELFWKGYGDGAVVGNHYALWQYPAFQHGGPWDVSKVCCVTLFSYRLRQMSTSRGDAHPDEGVAGYLVEFSK